MQLPQLPDCEKVEHEFDLKLRKNVRFLPEIVESIGQASSEAGNILALSWSNMATFFKKGRMFQSKM